MRAPHAARLNAARADGGRARPPVGGAFRGAAARSYVCAIASFGLAIGALWETFEWFVLRRLMDPVNDLMMDTIGAVVAGLLAAWALRQESDVRGVRG